MHEELKARLLSIASCNAGLCTVFGRRSKAGTTKLGMTQIGLSQRRPTPEITVSTRLYRGAFAVTKDMHLVEAKNEAVPRDDTEESEAVPTERSNTLPCARLHNPTSGDGLVNEGRARCDPGV